MPRYPPKKSHDDTAVTTASRREKLVYDCNLEMIGKRGEEGMMRRERPGGRVYICISVSLADWCSAAKIAGESKRSNRARPRQRESRSQAAEAGAWTLCNVYDAMGLAPSRVIGRPDLCQMHGQEARSSCPPCKISGSRADHSSVDAAL